MDSAGPPAPGPQSMSSGTPASQPVSMRDSLGAPGQNGQQILDKQFVRSAAESGLADVKLGSLAAEKGSPEVKELAQKLMADHTTMNSDLATIADTLGVMLPKKVSKDGQAEYNKLNGLSGKDFDTEYLTFIVKAHREELHSFYMESSIAVNPELQTEVVKALGTMREHLGMIAKTATAEGVTLPPRPPRPTATTAKN
jgi:putative membrane protein